MTRGRYSGWEHTGLSLRCRRCRRWHGVKLCTSSVRDRQLNERSRCSSAGQPDSGGRRSILRKREAKREKSNEDDDASQSTARLELQGRYRLSAKLRYLRRGKAGLSLIHVRLQLFRNSSQRLRMTTPADIKITEKCSGYMYCNAPGGGASAICVWNKTTRSSRGHASRPSQPLTSLPLTSTDRRWRRGGKRRNPLMGLLQQWRCTSWVQAARQDQSPLVMAHLKGLVTGEIKEKNAREKGIIAADLLRDSERSREQAAAPEASVMGFSSQVRKRREGKARQKDKSVRRLQLKQSRKCYIHRPSHIPRLSRSTRTCNPAA
jgi:hypothetical protein